VNIIKVRIRRGVTAAMAAVVLVTGACGSDDGSGKAASAAPAKTTPTAPAGNGMAEKSADEILKAAKNAFATATSVHVKGSMEDKGEKMTMDLYLGRDGTKGSIKAPMGGKSYTVSLISVNGKFYMKSPGLWRATGGAAAANLVGNRWVLVPTKNSKDFAEFERMASLEKFAEEMLTTGDEVFAKGETSVVDGKPAITLKDKESILHIATTDTPYILRIEPVKPAKKGEGIDFLDYNAPLKVAPPTDVLDLDELR
jgi:hypothetical protein